MSVTVLSGDVRETLKTLPDNSIQCCITSPPYYALRNYGTGHWTGGDECCDHAAAKVKTRFDYEMSSEKQATNAGSDVPQYRRLCPACGAEYIDLQIGSEETPAAYVQNLVDVFREVRRVLRPDGVLWLNLGDSMIEKQLQGTPWRVAFALQADGWYLRQAIPWVKESVMPESVTDRPSTSHEYIFQLSKQPSYYYDIEAVRIPYKTTSIERVQQKTFDQQTGGSKDYSGAGRNDRSARRSVENLARKINADRGDGGKSHWDGTAGGRNRRTGDWYTESLDLIIAQVESHLAHLAHVRSEGGLVVGMDDQPAGMLVNPQPYKGAHFATYPERLVEPCLLASTSPRACEHCGTPWRRMVEKESTVLLPRGTSPSQFRANFNGDSPQQSGVYVHTKTLGWEQGCTCADCEGRGVCIVLDPFLGSGTTARVAIKHGCDCIGCELNDDYRKQSDQRTDQVQISMMGVL